MDRIFLDFQKAKRQAQTIEDLATQLRELKNEEYNQTMQALSNQWKSESANAFLNKGSTLGESLAISANNLDRIAENVRRTARVIYEAEKAAEAIAANRTAKS